MRKAGARHDLGDAIDAEKVGSRRHLDTSRLTTGSKISLVAVAVLVVLIAVVMLGSAWLIFLRERSRSPGS